MPKTTPTPIAIFVSDLHAGLRLPHAKVSPDMTTSDRLDDVMSIIEQVTEYVKEHSVPHVFIAGDLFDKRHPDAPTMIKTANALYKLGEETTNGVGILPGNHDAHDRAGKVYSIDLFDALRTDVVYSLNDPAVNPLVISADPLDPIHLLAVPWVPDKLFTETVKEMVDDGLPSGRNVLVFHQTVTGATDNGHEAKDALPPRMFEAFDLAISGHIHHPQRIGNVQYLGSPLHLRFSDVNDNERGFWVLYDDLSMEMVQTDFPRFIRWSFLSDDDYTATQAVRDLCFELWDEVKEEPHPPYVDVIIEGPREDVEEALAEVHRVCDEPSLTRMLRVNVVMTDDGASERVREAITAPGAAATTSDLVRAFVAASESKWPSGVTDAELLAAVEGVL